MQNSIGDMALFQFPPLSKYRVLCLFYVLLRMKNKSVQNCRFVHHAKFHCIMTTLNRLFKIEIQRGGGGGNWKRAGDIILANLFFLNDESSENCFDRPQICPLNFQIFFQNHFFKSNIELLDQLLIHYSKVKLISMRLI